MASVTLRRQSERGNVVIRRSADVLYESVPIYGAIAGPQRKVLSRGLAAAFSTDPDLQVDTWFTHIAPTWADMELVYHPCVEEGLVLAGGISIGGRFYGPGCYFYRPPGIQHGPCFAVGDGGVLMFHRFQSEGGLLRYEGDEFPVADIQPVNDEYLDWPVEWVEHVDSESLPWTPVSAGPWAGSSLKWLARNRQTGGGTLLIELPAGWQGEGSRALGALEEFVVCGALSMGPDWFERWGYACRPAGAPAGSYSAVGGALLICVWDENELD